MNKKHLRKFFIWSKSYAILGKEFTTILKDPTTNAMIISIPIIQLLLFGYAISTHPKYLPTVLVTAEHTEYLNFTGSFSKHKAKTNTEDTFLYFIKQLKNTEQVKS